MRATTPVAEVPAKPPDTPALLLLRTGAQSLVKVLGRRKAERFLSAWVEALAREDAVLSLHPKRQTHEREAERQNREQALAWLRASIPAFIAAIDD